MIPEEKIEEVLQATDIVALIESYFPLKRAGTNFRAVCPFHNEKTPSFNVNPQRQIFKCFGCGVGGNAITFVRDYEGLTFREAFAKLADAAGVHYQEDQPDPQAIARQKTRSKLVQLHKKSTEWFHEVLLDSPAANNARAYLKGRGINDEIARNWRIGYAPDDGGKQFLAWAKSEGFSASLLIQSGLAALKEENDPGRGLYARFRNRVMFPIANDYGDVIAFSGRILDPNSKLAKYMNSPETPLFLKSKTFYGFDKSKRPIIKEKRAIVCEGQLDLITCFEHGIENVIAPLGTAFTPDHARTMKRYAEEVILCNDADAAGYKATERSFAHLAKEKVVVRVVEMPPGQDPDTLIRSAGIGPFQELVDAAQHFWDFQIDHLSSNMNLNDPRDRVQFANILATTVAHVADKVVQDGLVHQVATRLRIPAEDFRSRVATAAKRLRSQAARSGAYAESNPSPPDGENTLDPIQVDNTDIVVLCKLALTDPETRAFLTAERARMEAVKQVLEADVLIKLWGRRLRCRRPDQSERLPVLATRPRGGLLHRTPDQKDPRFRACGCQAIPSTAGDPEHRKPDGGGQGEAAVARTGQ